MGLQFHKYKVGDRVHLTDDYPFPEQIPHKRNLEVSEVTDRRRNTQSVRVKHPKAPGWESEEFDSAWIMPA